MKRSVFIIFGLLLINILFISADPCQTSDGVTCCYGTCNWGLPGPDSTDGSCGGQCQNWGCVACAPSCSPSCACAVNTCTGQSCDDGCGGTCAGTKCCSTCGDSLIQCSETCDDGNTQSGDGCSNVCITETYSSNYCGDNVIFPLFETCDDGNKISFDGCSSTCLIETYDDDYCGDNVLFVGSEGCDDGNLINLDGCSSTCNVEIYDNSYCGDGVLFIGSEGCDDGNIISGDSCSSTCKVETYDNSYCGDGIMFKGFEECDDRNKVNGDGCSSVCVLQPEAYFLNSNGQRITEAHIGETVKLVFNNTGILNGSFSFEIFEDDPAFDDEIRTGINAISGTFSNIGWGIIIGEWTITGDDYSLTEIGDYDGFYFKINGFESNRLEILVQDVTPWCSNYETEVSCSDCDYIGCNAAENSVNEKVFEAFPEVWNDTKCGDEIAGPDPSCSYLMFCKCIWNSSISKCDYTWSSSPGLYYYDPFKLSQRCIGGSNIIPCPAEIQLPFFGFSNLIITIFLIVGIYSLIYLRRN